MKKHKRCDWSEWSDPFITIEGEIRYEHINGKILPIKVEFRNTIQTRKCSACWAVENRHVHSGEELCRPQRAEFPLR